MRSLTHCLMNSEYVIQDHMGNIHIALAKIETVRIKWRIKCMQKLRRYYTSKYFQCSLAGRPAKPFVPNPVIMNILPASGLAESA